MKSLRYMIEAVLLKLLFLVFKAMPAEKASNAGGWIARTIGMRLAVNRKAMRHLDLAFPDMPQDRKKEILSGMWDNLGRVIAEYPHLEYIGAHCVEVKGKEALDQYIQGDHPVVFVGGHFANWEMYGTGSLFYLDVPLHLTYREPNNPWTAKMLEDARTMGGKLTGYPKSRESGRLILQAMKNNAAIGFLIDQKYNEGITVDFFGSPAMTNPIPVILSQRFKCPLIPVRVVRTHGCHFVLELSAPIRTFDDAGEALSQEKVLADIHDLLEGWIRERPEQWLWLHRRWKNIGDD